MKTEYCRYFNVLKNTGSYTRAAEELYITQPTLSKNIMAMEKELGGALFIRKNNKIVLTSFGEYIESYLDNILYECDILNTAYKDYKMSRQQKLSMLSMTNFSYSGILTPILDFESNESNFHIETNECSHPELQRMLTTKVADVCIGYKELLGNIAGYRRYDLLVDPLVFVTSKNNYLKKGYGTSVTFSNIKNESFCFPRGDLLLFNYIVKSCNQNKIHPELTMSNVRLGTISKYMAYGIRSTIHPKSISSGRFNYEEYVILDITDAPALTLSIFVNSNNSNNLLVAFTEKILSYYKK